MIVNKVAISFFVELDFYKGNFLKYYEHLLPHKSQTG